MADIEINLPVDKRTDIAYSQGYRDTVENPDFDDQLPEEPITNPKYIPNPISKQDWVRAQLIVFLKVRHREWKLGTLVDSIEDELNQLT
jgi:hypothetical protein